MFISENNISLRIAEPEDAEVIYRWENDRSVWRVSETIAPVSRFQIEQFLLSNTDLTASHQLRLMVELHPDGPIGCIDLFDYDPINSRIGIGVLIDAAHRGNGYAHTAINSCLDYLFNNLMVHQVHCLIDERNTASLHLFQQLGFECCGRRKDWIQTPEGYLDALFHQLINPKHHERNV